MQSSIFKALILEVLCWSTTSHAERPSTDWPSGSLTRGKTPSRNLAALVDMVYLSHTESNYHMLMSQICAIAVPRTFMQTSKR